MKNAKWQAQRGMVLIEAMVALVVMAAGILGVAKLNTFFIEVSGQSKARTQAVQLAEGKLEELRSLMVKTQFTAIANGTETVSGYSASGVQSTTFTRSWTKVDNGAEGRALTVSVSWADRAGTTQQVTVRSVVAWDDPGKALARIEGNEAAGTHASTPTGRAEIPDSAQPIDVSSGATPTVDNLRLKQIGGKWHLADSTGKVLLVATRENEQFSQIAGRVYIDQNAGNGQNALSNLRNEDVYVVISDASFCSMTPVKNPASPSFPTNYDTGAIYKYFSYRCYIGANWFGNIGVVRTDSNVPTNDRTCLGDPAVAAATKSDNRHPVLGTSRMYRGYISSGNSVKSSGIGVQTSDPNAYTAAVYDGHDFLLTHITGNPSDSDCSAKLKLYDNTAPTYDPFSTDAVTHNPVTETAYLDGGNTVVLGNPGRFFCLTAACPDLLPNAPAPQITITVRVTVTRSPNNDKPTIDAMSTNSGDCVFDGQGSTYEYDCSFTGVGFTGGSWAGSITASAAGDAYICNTPTTGSVNPRPAAPATSTQEPFTFDFNNQSVDAGNATFGFKIGKALDDCNQP